MQMETDTLLAELNTSPVPNQAMDSLQQELYKCTRRYKEEQSKILLTPREVLLLFSSSNVEYIRFPCVKLVAIRGCQALVTINNAK